MTYLEARTLLDFRMAAIGKRPWFWRWRARKEWQRKASAILVQFAIDSIGAYQAEQIDAVKRARAKWGQARVEDGEAN